MRILILTQYYPPEVGAAQNRLSCLARCLAKAEHRVTVLTAVPNYPTGTIHEGYKNRLVVREVIDDVTIIRTWLYTKPSLNFIGRLANYLSFSALALVMALSKVGPQDVVITECPSLFAGIAGFIISKYKRAKFALNISDLWTDSAVDLGVLKNHSVIALAHRMEHFLYRKADLVTCQTQGIVNGVRMSGSRAPIALITNGIDREFFKKASESRAKKYATEAPPSEKFVVGYAGLHGLVQDLKTVIEAAGLLRDNHNVTFAFYGDGPQKEALLRQVREAQLTNVTFFPSQPVERMPEIFSRFDVMVVPLKDLPILRGAIPCKLLEAMGAGLPILFSGLGEAKTVLEQAQCGIVVAPEAPSLLADAVRELYRNEPLRTRFGDNGRQYALEHYSRERINERFEGLLMNLFCRDGDGEGKDWVKA